MLVLTRKPQEKIQIGDNITITIIKTKGKAVRIGIEAPKDIAVLRGELIAAESSDGRTAEATVATEEHRLDESKVEETSEVKFTRAPRSRVTSVLPHLLGDAGPLREMLLHRTEATI